MNLRHHLGSLRRRALCALYRRTVSLGNRGPIVSFTFDDFPRTAYSTGGQSSRNSELGVPTTLRADS